MRGPAAQPAQSAPQLCFPVTQTKGVITMFTGLSAFPLPLWQMMLLTSMLSFA